MIRLIASRLLWSIPLLFVVSLLVFILQSLLPGDAAQILAGLNATPEQVEQLRRTLRLDQPVLVQYWHWLSGAMTGDLGTSFRNNESVTEALNGRLAVTVSLVGLATVLALVLGVGFGLVSSLGGRVARVASDVLSILGAAVPGFIIAIALVGVFSVGLGWFPANGYVRPEHGVGLWLQALVLPVIALAFANLTSVAKLTREGMKDVMQRDFVRNLRANGMSRSSIVLKHALRNASLPVVTTVGLSVVASLTSAVVLEQIFGLPGLGSLAISATFGHDIPVMQGVAVYFTLIVIGINLLLDIVYGVLNPKVRH
ncbi:ABC transporter permease [Microbacterium album]|uniref:ABC transporter permease n=1 Tax=Microbacterium album TaxID=2053191 RepID=A0A917IGX0_9MICO|nr:ABC transporter permease [Microbacterium album]GGH48569.1 ABC transporter permease [Microbacterium album]